MCFNEYSSSLISFHPKKAPILKWMKIIKIIIYHQGKLSKVDNEIWEENFFIVGKISHQPILEWWQFRCTKWAAILCIWFNVIGKKLNFTIMKTETKRAIRRGKNETEIEAGSTHWKYLELVGVFFMKKIDY